MLSNFLKNFFLEMLKNFPIAEYRLRLCSDYSETSSNKTIKNYKRLIIYSKIQLRPYPLSHVRIQYINSTIHSIITALFKTFQASNSI